jgi:hypothetical protein
VILCFYQPINNKNMKRLITTEFFLALQETLQTGIDVDLCTLAKEYDEFSAILFAENATSSDKVSCHNELIFTRVELSGLTGVTEKKRGYFSQKSH